MGAVPVLFGLFKQTVRKSELLMYSAFSGKNGKHP
jgi:hypothetical protein